eukprot:scaffold8418_cov106-Isochrysis_galbana.AAC.11
MAALRAGLAGPAAGGWYTLTTPPVSSNSEHEHDAWRDVEKIVARVAHLRIAHGGTGRGVGAVEAVRIDAE